MDGPGFGGLSEAEVKGVVGIGEGGDVKVFCDGMVESAFGAGFTEREEFHFAIGVGDFSDGGNGFSCITIDVVERNWVEGVAEDARESDELDDRIGRDLCAFFRKPCGEVFADGFFGVGVDVIAIVDGEEVEAILGEEGDVGKSIEVDGEHEDSILEGVFFGGDTGVGDVAFVQGIFNAKPQRSRRDAKLRF